MRMSLSRNPPGKLAKKILSVRIRLIPIKCKTSGCYKMTVMDHGYCWRCVGYFRKALTKKTKTDKKHTDYERRNHNPVGRKKETKELD